MFWFVDVVYLVQHIIECYLYVYNMYLHSRLKRILRGLNIYTMLYASYARNVGDSRGFAIGIHYAQHVRCCCPMMIS